MNVIKSLKIISYVSVVGYFTYQATFTGNFQNTNLSQLFTLVLLTFGSLFVFFDLIKRYRDKRY